MNAKSTLVSLALRGIASGGLPKPFVPSSGGEGGILSFHRVYDPRPGEVEPRSLSVTPAHFRAVVRTLIQRGYQFLSMSGLVERLDDIGQSRGKFVCLTFDDGFADNYLHAFPVCREFGVPMTVYLVSGCVKREFPMWSFGLAAAIARSESIEVAWNRGYLHLAAGTMAQKRRAYRAIASHLVTASPDRTRQCCAEIGVRYGVDFMNLSDRNALSPAMIREMQDSGLVEFGAHGVHHAYLSRLDDASLRYEVCQSKRDCEAIVGAEVCHFAYPYGDRHSAGPREAAVCREFGFKSAVTTECNTLFASDRDRLWSLPRLTYNGDFQDTPLLDLLLSGALPFLRALRDQPVRTLFRNFPPRRLSGAANGAPAKRPCVQ